MASTYSQDLSLELVATGEKAGLWGSITNTNLQILETATAFKFSGWFCNSRWKIFIFKTYRNFNR